MRSIAVTLLAILPLGTALTTCSSSAPVSIVKPTPGSGHWFPCPRSYRCESFTFDVCEQRGQDIPVLPHRQLARCDPATEQKEIPGSYTFTVSGQVGYNRSGVWDTGDFFMCPDSSYDLELRIDCFTRDNGGRRTGHLTYVARVRVNGRANGQQFHRAYHIDVDVDRHGHISVSAFADTTSTRPVPIYVYRPGHCVAGYSCEPVHEQVCSSHGKDPYAQARLTLGHVPPARCNEYIFDMSLVVASNGSRVQIVPYSLTCPVKVAHIRVRVHCSTEPQISAGFNWRRAAAIAHVDAEAPQYGYEAIVEVRADTHGRISNRTMVP